MLESFHIINRTVCAHTFMWIMHRKVWRGEPVPTMVGGAGLPRGEPSALFLYSLHSTTVTCFCIICVVKNLGGS